MVCIVSSRWLELHGEIPSQKKKKRKKKGRKKERRGRERERKRGVYFF